jgi:flagellar M-ring protein FliF
LAGLAQTLRGLGAARLAAIAIVTAGMIGFFAYLANHVATPSMSLLFSDIELRDSSQIVQKLEAMGVPYQVRGDGGQILVPSDQVAKLRMAMAEAGLPRGGSIGYEIFDKSDALGTSSLVQNINQVRALEGELARTISSLSPVYSARVHLVLPRREMFSRERLEPSASVVIKMRGAERLGRPQVAAVRHLVASAVPGLKPTHVAIVDGDGALLARGDGDGAEDGTGGNAEEQRVNYENRLSRHVEELLERSVGPGKARVDVHADMDFDKITTSSESYDPDGQVVRSTQSSTDSSDSNEAGDQPVTVTSNLPNNQTAAGSAGGKSKSARTEETVNYEITKTVRSQVREAGVVRRLSVAVLVDGTYAPAADGTRAYQPRPPEELKQLTALARSAIGYDEKRGDALEVINLRFTAPEELPAAASTMILGLERAELMRIGELLVIALLGVLFLLLVARPLLLRLAETAARIPALLPVAAGGAGAPALLSPGANGAARAAAGPDSMIDIGQVEGRVAASGIRKVGEIVDKHPDEAVAIVRSWMYQDS